MVNSMSAVVKFLIYLQHCLLNTLTWGDPLISVLHKQNRPVPFYIIIIIMMIIIIIISEPATF